MRCSRSSSATAARVVRRTQRWRSSLTRRATRRAFAVNGEINGSSGFGRGGRPSRAAAARGPPEKAPRRGGDVGAPMPGVVVDVKVGEGDVVSKGETLFVLSAMKMESTIVAPAAGTVTSVLCAIGDNIEAEHLLATLCFSPPPDLQANMSLRRWRRPRTSRARRTYAGSALLMPRGYCTHHQKRPWPRSRGGGARRRRAGPCAASQRSTRRTGREPGVARQ